ncbi:hypothetical protein AAGG52_01735 [Bacillus licheniformis]
MEKAPAAGITRGTADRRLLQNNA